MKRLLVQTQLSNVTPQGKFVLEADSGWQMVMGRVREMLKLNSELCVDVMCPNIDQLVNDPTDVNADLWAQHGFIGDCRLDFIQHRIIPNALVTRYDFDWEGVKEALSKKVHYDAVYINDPMHLRNFKALFHVVAGYQPFFAVHSHFVDCPSRPKFPSQASLWMGQVEACMRADWNFWQCSSALEQFEADAGDLLLLRHVDAIVAKSEPWDDGYSVGEITTDYDMNRVRFSVEEWIAKTKDKVVLFFPNRISPSSGDYTNGMKFMFEVLPELRKRRQDFVVVAGNPNLKFTNDELVEKCGANGFIKVVPDTLNRDEYKFVASHSDIALGLYNSDTYGGTAARECIELGCMPLWLDNFEYTSIAREAGNWPFLVNKDMRDLSIMADALIHNVKERKGYMDEWRHRLQNVVRSRCSYEATTPAAMKRMDLL